MTGQLRAPLTSGLLRTFGPARRKAGGSRLLVWIFGTFSQADGVQR
jgi:hypothetical protein